MGKMTRYFNNCKNNRFVSGGVVGGGKRLSLQLGNNYD